MSALARHLEDYPDRIAEVFENKTVLVTGGTGFVGKVLVEKLLRCCNRLKKIYILIRTKKGKSPKERLESIFSGPLFDMLRQQRGDEAFAKVEAIPCDLEAPDLAFSLEDRRKLCEEVELIYHSGANVRFDDSFRKSVFMNTRGTLLMLQLAKECKNLSFFCHVSTAYCHPHEKVLYENTYPPPADPYKVIHMCELLDEKTLEDIKHRILGTYPNTYVYTKALAEALVSDEMSNLSIVITRPSVVIPTWIEPLPGWTDNFNGPMGLLIGTGKGVIRSMYGNSKIYVDYIPVDIVANALLFVAFAYKTTGKNIYNLTTSAEHKITFDKVLEIGRYVMSNSLPFNWVLWYPGGSLKTSKVTHYICVLLCQLFPAVFLDGILLVLGYKPVLIRVQKRILKSYEIFEYYANNQWDFNNDEFMMMRNILNPREKATYKLDGEGINYYDYFTLAIHAARLYLLNESDDTIPTAKRHMYIMWLLDKMCNILFLLGAFYLFYKYFLT